MGREHEDAYGQELLYYLEHGEGMEIVERDDGLIEAYDARVYFAPYRRWPTHHRKAMRLARGRVLDIGCGAGRHALHLQEQGLDVTGIDLSPLAVEVCRRRGLRQVEVMPVTRLSRRLGLFDTLLMLGNNFGLMGSFRRARWLLRRFRGLTTGQGRIIAEGLDPYQTDDPIHLEYHARNRRRGRMGGQIRLRVRHRRCTGPWFDYLFASREELQEILAGTGWFVGRFVESGGPIYISVLEKEE